MFSFHSETTTNSLIMPRALFLLSWETEAQKNTERSATMRQNRAQLLFAVILLGINYQNQGTSKMAEFRTFFVHLNFEGKRPRLNGVVM